MVAGHDRRAVRGGALGPGDGRPHRPPAQAVQRGGQALGARRRPASCALVAIERAVALLVEYGGGTARRRGARPRPRAAAVAPIDASTPTCRPGVAGVPYAPGRVVDAAGRDRLRGRPSTATGSSVTPPTWRPDLTDPADLVEEVVRLDGYDNVPSLLPVAPPGNGLTAAQRRRRSVGRALAEAGYVEVLSYPFVGRGRARRARAAGRRRPAPDAVRLANPLSDEEPSLRTTLLPPLLATLRRNVGPGQPRRGAVRDRAGVPAPARRGRAAGRWAWTQRPVRRGAVAAAETRSCRASRGTSPRCWPARSSRPAGGAPGRPASWADAVEAARVVLAAAGVPRRG